MLFDEKCDTLQNSIGESKMLLFEEKLKTYRTATAKVRCCCLTKQEGPFCKIADLRMK